MDIRDSITNHIDSNRKKSERKGVKPVELGRKPSGQSQG